MQSRRHQVLRNMGKHGWLGGAELESAMSSPLGVGPRGLPLDIRHWRLKRSPSGRGIRVSLHIKRFEPV